MRHLIQPGLFLVLALPAAFAVAQTTTPTPAVGDRGVAIADAPVPRPSGTACVVDLYANVAFDDHGESTSRDAKPREFSYTPPAQCAGSWAKVVLEADFSVDAGRQYDRTASLWLGGVNLYYGTTQEPGAKVAPHWHVERDVTDYASLFRNAGHGQVVLNNWVGGKRDSVIHGSARLVFYPAAGHTDPAPADLAIGLVGDSGGHPVDVQDETQTLARALTLPRNVERVALDLIAQSQAVDEQWYMCIDDADVEPTREFSLGPPNAGDPLEQCGGGNYREVAVSIDGQPAGRAPVYPWTYTGGVDPNLWRPTPDIQTLNFIPYRMDLTPFAALLDDGKPHTLAVRVLGAHDFFSLAANLLVWRDHGVEVLTGKLTQNTLATQQGTLQPKVQRHFDHGTGDTLHGEVDTRQRGTYAITGELQTSRGKVVTQVAQNAGFDNDQTFDLTAQGIYHQYIRMTSRVDDDVTTTTDAGTTQKRHRLYYPLTIDIRKQVHAGGDFTADITLQQGYESARRNMEGKRVSYGSMLTNHLESHSNTDFNAGGTAITGSRGQNGLQTYSYGDSQGNCYARRVETRNQAVVAVATNQTCPEDPSFGRPSTNLGRTP
ncbi:peptide-N(4)-(N-acetyl-beta-glucosaminyl)asparagine amidase [Rhodanobacter sp. 7MK24]|uniref:peptide-N4-asparagine amidase n=1 Tax=Rhodanobacter sp. 7MK24 TaxID=2775922 RepID=UPI00177EF9C4|nr:peptide-N4-asparagine amidase [Rhodanobacter sp. 7MK24]MBD8879686.1 peptide-N(4)-(N-acetyl-beta-glucosaminyl)asparagine amidase [Rhodanobacter sp. 7MK24]